MTHLDWTDVSVASILVRAIADGLALARRRLKTALPGLRGYPRQSKRPSRSAPRRDRWHVRGVPAYASPEGALLCMQMGSAKSSASASAIDNPGSIYSELDKCCCKIISLRT